MNRRRFAEDPGYGKEPVSSGRSMSFPSIWVANSGEKALAMVQDDGQPQPDLILLDVQMPGLDG